jgi:hypothetical protein
MYCPVSSVQGNFQGKLLEGLFGEIPYPARAREDVGSRRAPPFKS